MPQQSDELPRARHPDGQQRPDARRAPARTATTRRMPKRSMSAAENGAVEPEQHEVDRDGDAPITPDGQPNSSCSGVDEHAGVDRKPAAPMIVRKVTAATHQAGWIRGAGAAARRGGPAPPVRRRSSSRRHCCPIARTRTEVARKDRMCKDPAMTSTSRPTASSQDLVTGPARRRTASWSSRSPSVVAFELGLPHRFFAANSIDPAWTGAGAYTPSRAPAYEVLTVTVDDGPVTTSAGTRSPRPTRIPCSPTADTIVIPGIVRPVCGRGRRPARPTSRRCWRPPDRGARWVSICTGAFVLAGAGLLDGLEATTHWAHAEHFRRLSRGSGSTRTSSTSTTATSSPRPATPPASTCCCTSCAATSAPTPPTGSPAARSSRRGEPAGRPSSSSGRCPRAGDAGTGPARAWALDHLDEPVTLASLAAGRG